MAVKSFVATFALLATALPIGSHAGVIVSMNPGAQLNQNEMCVPTTTVAGRSLEDSSGDNLMVRKTQDFLVGKSCPESKAPVLADVAFVESRHGHPKDLFGFGSAPMRFPPH
jgi:hypothetical protein